MVKCCPIDLARWCPPSGTKILSLVKILEASGTVAIRAVSRAFPNAIVPSGEAAVHCASTLAVIKRETGGWKWVGVTFGYMLALAYAAAVLTYQIARALGAG